MENLPVYIHCLDGTNVVGLVIMCLRKLQNWIPSSIASEFSRHICSVLFLDSDVICVTRIVLYELSRFTLDNRVDKEETKFLKEFNSEIEIPQQIPPWLWSGRRIAWHPSIRLRHVPPLAADVLSGGGEPGTSEIHGARHPLPPMDSQTIS